MSLSPFTGTDCAFVALAPNSPLPSSVTVLHVTLDAFDHLNHFESGGLEVAGFNLKLATCNLKGAQAHSEKGSFKFAELGL